MFGTRAHFGQPADPQHDTRAEPAERQAPTTGIELVRSESSGPLVEAFVAGRRPCPAFLGISLKNKMANKRALAKMIPWLAERATRSLIVIGDYPHRHNLVALRGLSPHGALQKAMADGTRTLRYAREITAACNGESSVTVHSAADFIETSGCRDTLRRLTAYFHEGGPFVDQVVSAAVRYANRACPELPAAHANCVLPTLKDYVLEELAMFLHLYDLGYLVEVYPGPDLPLMRNLATSAYERFPFQCPDRTHISIAVACQRGESQ